MNKDLKEFLECLLIGVCTVGIVALLFIIPSEVWYIIGQILKYTYWLSCFIIGFTALGYGIRSLGGKRKA